MNIRPIKFACDALPDCQGQIVESIGNFVIIEGLAQDSGAWFAKGVGGARRFGTRQEAVDYIEYAQDAKDGGPGSGPQEGGASKKEPYRGNAKVYKSLIGGSHADAVSKLKTAGYTVRGSSRGGNSKGQTTYFFNKPEASGGSSEIHVTSGGGKVESISEFIR